VSKCFADIARLCVADMMRVLEAGEGLAPWMALWPGLAISIAIYGLNMFGDAVRDLLDPRLKGVSGDIPEREKNYPSV
jgi:hypothetical protein